MGEQQKLQKADPNTGEYGETIYIDLTLRVLLPVGMTQEQFREMVENENPLAGGNLYVGWSGEVSQLMTIDDVTGGIYYPDGWE